VEEDLLPAKGIYTLIIYVRTNSRIKVHKLGCFNFQKGYYAYTGSALGEGATNLRTRVARHLKKKKNKQWHIDFLLTNKNANVTTVVAAASNVNEECRINHLIKNIEGATVPAWGFGASDCKQNCKSHLLYLNAENPNERITDVYKQVFRHSVVLNLSVKPELSSVEM